MPIRLFVTLRQDHSLSMLGELPKYAVVGTLVKQKKWGGHTSELCRPKMDSVNLGASRCPLEGIWRAGERQRFGAGSHKRSQRASEYGRH